ncbi:MAG: hypothetical protein Q9162_000780, partial [Coniocarpon cinnabarinum]
GNWVESKSGDRFDVIDPGSGKAWASAPVNAAADVDDAAKAAHDAFLSFGKTVGRQRAKWLLECVVVLQQQQEDKAIEARAAPDSQSLASLTNKLAASLLTSHHRHRLIDENKDDLAQIVTHETGKPLAESYGEIAYAQGFTFFFAGECERIAGTVSRAAMPGRRIFTVKQPIGVAVALVPWNFPIAMILRKCGAALAAGCTMLIKPSPETPLSVLLLVDLALRAGFPTGVLNVLTTDLRHTPSLSEALIRHPLTKKVSFTGSTRVGKLVASLCAEGLKKCTLELGGNCPFIVFDDADVEKAVDALFLLKWRHAGQACISANRVLVQEGVYERFEETLVRKTREVKVGHGAAEGTTMGPLTTERSIPKVREQIADAKKLGGRVVLGGDEGGMKEGYFFSPTIIGDMKPTMQTTREEVFGPLCALYRFRTESEAVKMANDTSMGLASYFFTKDSDRTWRLLENLGETPFLSSVMIALSGESAIPQQGGMGKWRDGFM